MIFTVIRPDGTKELRKHVMYSVRQTGATWEALRKDGSLLGRSQISEKQLRKHCDSCTEPA